MEGPRTAARERNPRQDRAHAPAPDHARLLTPAPTRRRSRGDPALSERRGVSGPLPSAGSFRASARTVPGAKRSESLHFAGEN